MPKFYEYIMAEEVYVNPNTLKKLVGNNQESIYFHNNSNYMHSLSSEPILLERIEDKLSYTKMLSLG